MEWIINHFFFLKKSRGLVGISLFFKELPLGKDLNNLNLQKNILKANMFFPSTFNTAVCQSLYKIISVNIW